MASDSLWFVEIQVGNERGWSRVASRETPTCFRDVANALCREWAAKHGHKYRVVEYRRVEPKPKARKVRT